MSEAAGGANSATNALKRARAVLATQAQAAEFDADLPELTDRGEEWLVRFPRLSAAKPAYAVFAVEKKSGAARMMP
ncbi:MAG: hypothetical protein ABJD07_16140 [Gemmatimonadaceae bacterium]